MKKFEIFGNVAFYDCVANNDTLTSVAQSVKWSGEVHKKGADTLYISSKDDVAFKVEYGSAIVPIKKDLYDSEYARCCTEKEASQAETVSEVVKEATPTIVKAVNAEQTEQYNPSTMISDVDFHEKVKVIVIEVLRQAIDTL